MAQSFISLNCLVDPITKIYCHLLCIDDYNILINCGSTNTLSTVVYQDCLSLLPTIDCVLLSHCELKYLGGLPYLFKNGLESKIYATIPVKDIGKLVVLEQNTNNKKFKDDENALTNTEILEVFDRIQTVKYTQPINVTSNLSITAYNSGHSIGGTVWKITKDLEDIIIMCDINHRKENHINGLDLSQLKNPFLCVIDSKYILKQPYSNKERDDTIISTINKTLEKNKRVLIFVSYSRLLEIAMMLDQHVKDKTMLISFYGQMYCESIKSLMEWAGEMADARFGENKTNPLIFPKMECSTSFSESEKNVYIAIDDGIESGWGRAILTEIGKDEENCILFLNEEGCKESLYNKLKSGIREFVIDIPKVLELEENEILNLQLEREAEIKANKMMEEYIMDHSEESEEIDISLIKKKFWHEYKPDLWIEKVNEKIFTTMNEVFKNEFTMETNYNVFPSEKKKPAYDAYGEILNIHEFQEINKIDENHPVMEQESEAVPQLEKIILKEENVFVKAKLHFIDFDGICDYKNCQTILESISPSKLVLLDCSEPAAEYFYYSCKFNPSYKDVIMLTKGIINLSSESSVSRIKLADGFIDSVETQKLGTDIIGAFKGEVNKVDGEMMLFYKCHITDTLCIGNIKIRELKRKFIENNMKAELLDNTLVVEDSIKIIENGDEIIIEGVGSELFLIVKDILYSNIVFVN
ncbi:Cleavage and polyadenylation specificity factor subunit 2 [Astathelohania contejeani]|uniref:Cleavage and polyadenylation specificity factor subunit 2 n=1 Tax=Astathelohania contejeani TaxID=164912 RepID=A0ABQ7HYT3_9MICR|nr:Cleavage and polyadenylation specificity factor subunit 2 [Thelohania contejeani]